MLSICITNNIITIGKIATCPGALCHDRLWLIKGSQRKAVWLKWKEMENCVRWVANVGRSHSSQGLQLCWFSFILKKVSKGESENELIKFKLINDDLQQ